jgi:hypothetical protein
MLDPALDDMFAPEAIADPHRYYARLREQDPVHWNDRYQLWVVTRYDDVVWMIRHHELFSSAVIRTDPRPPYPPVDAEGLGLVDYVRGFRADQLVEHDRPEHLAMRQIVYGYFTPRAMEAWRPFCGGRSASCSTPCRIGVAWIKGIRRGPGGEGEPMSPPARIPAEHAAMLAHRARVRSPGRPGARPGRPPAARRGAKRDPVRFSRLPAPTGPAPGATTAAPTCRSHGGEIHLAAGRASVAARARRRGWVAPPARLRSSSQRRCTTRLVAQVLPTEISTQSLSQDS